MPHQWQEIIVAVTVVVVVSGDLVLIEVYVIPFSDFSDEPDLPVGIPVATCAPLNYDHLIA
jgi:hypothetical protein